jgi:phosphoribosylaminoimidazole-succinocarboxamide synthase
MVANDIIKQQISYTLKETNFSSLGKKYRGKVRDVYTTDDKIFLIATDRQSAFDRNHWCPVKYQINLTV